MPPPVSKWQTILDFDRDNIVSQLLDVVPGIDWNAGIREFTRASQNLEQVDSSRMPWLFQTDGDEFGDNEVSFTMIETRDIIYTGFVKTDEVRFAGESAPDIRRKVVTDLEFVLDCNPSRNGLVEETSRTIVAGDDVNGAWSFFQLTETVVFRRDLPTT